MLVHRALPPGIAVKSQEGGVSRGCDRGLLITSLPRRCCVLPNVSAGRGDRSSGRSALARASTGTSNWSSVLSSRMSTATAFVALAPQERHMDACVLAPGERDSVSTEVPVMIGAAHLIPPLRGLPEAEAMTSVPSRVTAWTFRCLAVRPTRCWTRFDSRPKRSGHQHQR